MFPNWAIFWGLIGISESGINKVFFGEFIKLICKFVADGTDKDNYATDPGSNRRRSTVIFFDIFCYKHVLRAGVCRADCVHVSAFHS